VAGTGSARSSTWGPRAQVGTGARWGASKDFLTLVGEQGQSREWFRFTVGLERGFRSGLRTRFDATWEREGRLFGDGSTDDLFLRVRLFTALGG